MGSKAEYDIPKPRVQALSDLIFGLALSIGALTLLSQRPTSLLEFALSIMAFGFAFYVLATVWLTYTRVMLVLRVETGMILAVNLLLLFLVSIEPYMFNLVITSPASGGLSLATTTTLFAVDMGSINLILGYFSHEVTKEEGRSVPKELVRNFRILRNATLAAAAIFYVSTLPFLWDYALFGIQLRFVLWIGILLVRPLRKRLETRPGP